MTSVGWRAAVSPRHTSRATSRARRSRARGAASRDTPGGRAWDRAGARKRSCECVGAAAAARGGGGGWRPRGRGAQRKIGAARARDKEAAGRTHQKEPTNRLQRQKKARYCARGRECTRSNGRRKSARKRKLARKIEASPADAARTPRARMLSPSCAQRTWHACKIFWYPVNEHALSFIAMGLPSHDILNWLRYGLKYARHDFFHYFFAYITGLRHNLRALGSGAAVPVDVSMTCMHGAA
jgi:hypothetical protein